MALLEFLTKYFYLPLIQDAGYNLYNTVVYAIFLALVLIFLIPFILNALKVKVDFKFALGVLPYFILGSILRSSEDLGIFKSPLLVSPLIWILGIFTGFLFLVVSLVIERKFGISYYKIWGSLGLILSLVILYFFRFMASYNYKVFPIVLGIFLVWFIPLFLISKHFKLKWPAFTLGAHLFDATVTFTAIQFFSFREKHVLPSFLIGKIGPWTMFPLKLIVLTPIIYYIVKYVKKEQQVYYLLVIGSFGIITGLRDFLTLVCS